MAMKFHGNVRGEVQVNFLALFASKPHIFICGALKLSAIVRTNVRLNIAIPMLFFSKQGSTPTTWARGLRDKSKNARSRPRKPFVSRVFCAERGVETMVSDHGLGRGQTMG